MRCSKLMCLLGIIVVCGLVGTEAFAHGAEQSKVTLWKTPDGAIQPQSAVDSKGVVHLIYFRNGKTEGTGNLYYVRMLPNETKPSAPIRVNNVEDSAGSVGTVRTAQLAIGKGDRVHVVWNGLGPNGANGYPVAYQAYARLNETGAAFERQRDLMTWAKGIDGGGSVAADREGNVYVVWHALAGTKEESGRAVFVTRSTDNGATFSREKQANPEPTGACACCGMRAFAADNGVLYILYRAAAKNVERDTMLLVSNDRGKTFVEKRLDRWKINACPMSTYSLAESASGILAAWETSGRVYYGTINPLGMMISNPLQVSGSSQKHPFITVAPNGRMLLVWTEGTGWQRGGSLAWQTMDKEGKPMAKGMSSAAIPVWGLASAYARPDGSFVIVH